MPSKRQAALRSDCRSKASTIDSVSIFSNTEIQAFAIHRLDRYMEKTMFDRLVESSRQNPGRRAGRYLLVTGLIYALALGVFVALAVIGFNPVLADERSFLARVTLPSPVDSLPVRPNHNGPTSPIPDPTGRSLAAIPKTILPETNVSGGWPMILSPSGFKTTSGGSVGSLIGPETADPIPPPPAPSPTPKIEPAPEREPGPNKVSEGVLQGGAIKKVRPLYPEIAKKGRIGGPVQVQVTISEDGRVMEAFVLSGHILLRKAAIEAARQWVFAPTTLSKVPVKVQGVLTFNFMLE
jgi:TonB family protein